MERKEGRIQQGQSQIILRDAQQHVPTSTHSVTRWTGRIWVWSLDVEETVIGNVPLTVKSETYIDDIQSENVMTGDPTNKSDKDLILETLPSRKAFQ